MANRPTSRSVLPGPNPSPFVPHPDDPDCHGGAVALRSHPPGVRRSPGRSCQSWSALHPRSTSRNRCQTSRCSAPLNHDADGHPASSLALPPSTRHAPSYLAEEEKSSARAPRAALTTGSAPHVPTDRFLPLDPPLAAPTPGAPTRGDPLVRLAVKWAAGGPAASRCNRESDRRRHEACLSPPLYCEWIGTGPTSSPQVHVQPSSRAGTVRFSTKTANRKSAWLGVRRLRVPWLPTSCCARRPIRYFFSRRPTQRRPVSPTRAAAA